MYPLRGFGSAVDRGVSERFASRFYDLFCELFCDLGHMACKAIHLGSVNGRDYTERLCN